jgi:hypothetical protein
MQWAARTRRLAFGVERPCDFSRLWVDQNECVDARPLFVVGFDALEAEVDKPLRCKRAGIKCRVDVRDRRRGEVEGRRASECCDANGEKERAEGAFHGTVFGFIRR